MDYKIIAAIIGVFVVLTLLIMKKETKTVLVGVGLMLCVVALKPMQMLESFANAMTQAGLIKAICASMGFAFVMKYTKCDQHLVSFLTNPLKNLGFFLIPLTVFITGLLNNAIPSASGLAAAVGATLIPLLIASGVRPAMAGAAVMMGTAGGALSPASAHNIFVAEELAKVPIMTAVKHLIPSFTAFAIIALVGMSLIALLYKDYKKPVMATLEGGASGINADIEKDGESKQKANIVYALMPFVPLVVLIIGAIPPLADLSFLSWTKMGVAEAMILGSIVTIIATLTSPEAITKEFFKGTGSAYAEIIGIIIAATTFVAGLKACGAIDLFIEFLKSQQDFVRYGGTFGPFLMGVITGSGDAASMTFNTAVTPHAEQLGFNTSTLGTVVALCGALGRTASPIAGACIICAGLAGVNPFDIAKRTFPVILVAITVIAFFTV